MFREMFSLLSKGKVFYISGEQMIHLAKVPQ